MTNVFVCLQDFGQNRFFTVFRGPSSTPTVILFGGLRPPPPVPQKRLWACSRFARTLAAPRWLGASQEATVWIHCGEYKDTVKNWVFSKTEHVPMHNPGRSGACSPMVWGEGRGERVRAPFVELLCWSSCCRDPLFELQLSSSTQATDGATDSEIDLDIQFSKRTGERLMEPRMDRSVLTCKNACKQASN